MWAGPLIDADVHVQPAWADVLARMPRDWQSYARERGFGGTAIGLNHVYPPNAPTTVRPEWRPADGRFPGADLELLREQLLEPWDPELAILNCYSAVDWIRQPDFVGVAARAVNDWLAECWLDRDPRLRASLVVPVDNPAAAIEEIERLGDHAGFSRC